jgi:hypothetical protein
MPLFNERGEMLYLETARTVPGNMVALFDEEMNQLTKWETISLSWEVAFSMLREGVATHYLVWNKKDSFTRVSLPNRTRIRPEMDVKMSFWDIVQDNITPY